MWRDHHQPVWGPVWKDLWDGLSVPPAAATGGLTTVIDVGGTYYRVHTFASSGVLTVSRSVQADYLIVGGGGAGGALKNYGAGGGGGGGDVKAGQLTLTPSAYAAQIGAGGDGTYRSTAQDAVFLDGGNTLFAGLTANGGAGGAWKFASANDAQGRATGGSTGGASTLNLSNVTGTTTSRPVIAGQGNVNAGGAAVKNITGNGAFIGGGGGGAGGPGTDGIGGSTTYVAGNGGDGYLSSIAGSATRYGAGGGGGARDSTSTGGAGGAGGGGQGAVGGGAVSIAGANATGYGCGGGGARAQTTVPVNGGNGSAGVVIVRYQITQAEYLAGA